MLTVIRTRYSRDDAATRTGRCTASHSAHEAHTLRLDATPTYKEPHTQSPALLFVLLRLILSLRCTRSTRVLLAPQTAFQPSFVKSYLIGVWLETVE